MTTVGTTDLASSESASSAPGMPTMKPSALRASSWRTTSAVNSCLVLYMMSCQRRPALRCSKMPFSLSCPAMPAILSATTTRRDAALCLILLFAMRELYHIGVDSVSPLRKK